MGYRVAGQYILDAKGLQGAVDDLEELITHYRGNPLALKMAATSIQDLFAGELVSLIFRHLLEDNQTVFETLI